MIDGDKLYKKYSNVLNGPLYAEISEGWEGLVEDFVEEISEASRDFKQGAVTISQIKEKFGGMRIYVDYDLPSEQISDLEKIVIKYEKFSWRTCEVCSACDIVLHKRYAYWEQVICEECYQKANGEKDAGK